MSESLSCEACQVQYPIHEGIPILLMTEATPLGEEPAVSEAPKTSRSRAEAGEAKKALFTIVEGKNSGKPIQLEFLTCRAIGRSLEDKEKTQVFSVESAASLDDFSKKLVMNYISRQFEKKEKIGGGGDLGTFKRIADWQLDDSAVSRLHAMIFYGDSGVGILDLVSKNGTFVNGTEVESRLLKNDDLILIGGTKIRFQLG